MVNLNYSFLVVLLLTSVDHSIEECNERSYGEDSFVCVCNEEACDDFPQVELPLIGSYGVLTSSRELLRFNYEVVRIEYDGFPLRSDASIFINSSDHRQEMIGFGGALTDATGINIATLSTNLQETLIRQYFSTDGLEYNMMRIPIAGTDFSTYPYSYDEVEGDVRLQYFNLTQEDYRLKIPFIQKANAVSRRPVRLVASPWSPPSWMKENGMLNGTGGLLPNMSQPYANYIVKFFDAYKKEDIEIWGLTVQNEPTATDYMWNACRFTAEEERDFIRDFLGPTIAASRYSSLKLMIGDDNRYIYPKFLMTVLNDSESSSYVDGTAVHWYSDATTPSSILTDVHNLSPDKFILYTEACNGYIPGSEDPVLLGSWNRGEGYASNIIENLNHWNAGWLDWNMALDTKGGPSWVDNSVDSPIIINSDANEFYKQPMFYVMGHFSKFIPEGSTYVVSNVELEERLDFERSGIVASSFLNVHGYTVSVILNEFEEEKTVLIEDISGVSFFRTLPPKSIQTLLYPSKNDQRPN